MKKIAILIITAISLFFFYSCLNQTKNDKDDIISLHFDGSKEFQQIDGIGVNANTASWDESLKPALNMLLDSMNATIWRVIVESVEKWEDVNDNNDPFTFNWDYYNKLYETPKFQKVWDMIRYLNQHGITDKLMINFMGAVPLWMGGEVVKPEFEDEYIEMLVSFFYYARNVQHLHIGLISPMNESDIRREGPTVGPKQYVRLLKKMIYRMKDLGLGDIPYVAPDVAGIENGVNDFLPELMTDSVVMSKIAHLGLHSYYGLYTWGGNEKVDINAFIKQSSYPKSDYWVTEWNAWCDSCDNGILGEYNYDFASKCVGYLLDLFKNGATAGLVWEGYDSYYEHHAPSSFSYWGILGYDHSSKTYYPRKHFYAISQVSKFVSPGSSQIAVSGADSSLVVLAFFNKANGRMIITGINTKNQPVTINGELANLPEINSMEFYYTDSEKNLYKDRDIVVNKEIFKKIIPAKCIFTLTGKAENNY